MEVKAVFSCISLLLHFPFFRRDESSRQEFIDALRLRPSFLIKNRIWTVWRFPVAAKKAENLFMIWHQSRSGFDFKMFHSGLFAVVIVVAMMTVVTPLPIVSIVWRCGII
jgi:hypothetical protein